METQEQLKQLKLNVTNIKSVLIKKNENKQKSEKKEDDQEKRKLSIKKKQEEEKKLTAGASSLRKMASSVKSAITKPVGSLFDKMMDFGLIVLTGILVNALPELKKKLEEIFTAVSDFLTPVVDSLKTLIKTIGFITDENPDPKLDNEKILLLNEINNKKDTLLEDLKSQLGPLGGIIDLLKPVIDNLVTQFGTSLNIQTGGSKLTKNEAGEEGITSVDGVFTKIKFTEEQRQRFEKGDTRAYIMPTESEMLRIRTEAEAAAEGVNPSTGPLDPAHGAGASNPKSSVGFEAGKGGANKRIFLHWSAGSHTSAYTAYHSIALGDGSIVRHTPYSQDKFTHTAEANSNSVGLAIAAAAGAQERGKLGQYAPTKAQLDAMIYDAARLAVEWGWSEGTIDSNVRTHGEWERYATRNGILPGSPQRWDLDRLRDSDPLIDANKVLSHGGNELRDRIKATFRSIKNQASASSSTTSTAARISPTEYQNLNASALLSQPLDDEEGVMVIAPIVRNNYFRV